jgi:type II secretory pathway component GspD/PulD (secretin)
MFWRLFLFSLLVLTTVSAGAQDGPPATAKRGAYVVKYASAKDLAGVLAKQFKGVAEIQAGPEGTSNCLLINASPAILDEIMKTLEQLDHRPSAVAVEIFVIELPPKKAEDKSPAVEEKDLVGTLDGMTERVDALMKKGRVAGFQRMQLATLEGQGSALVVGENKPFVSGTNLTARGMVTRSFTYRPVGTTVKVTPQVAADGSIALDLNLQESRARPSATANVGMDENGKPIPATEFLQMTLAAKVSVASGKVVLAKDAKVTSKEGEGETLILVGARILAAETRGK